MNPDLEVAKRAIAQVVALSSAGKRRTGTAFFIGDKYAVTALHVVADTTVKPLRFAGSITLRFPNAGKHETPAGVAGELWDLDGDWVVLKCDVAPGVAPLHWAPVPQRDTEWEAFGYPEIQPAGMLIKGNVRDPNASLAKGDGVVDGAVVQLFCDEAAAGNGAKLHGLSGAPCLVAGTVVGVLRSTLVEEVYDGQLQRLLYTAAGTVYATPAKSVVDWQADRGIAHLADPWKPADIVAQEFIVLLSEHEQGALLGQTLELVAKEAHRSLRDGGVPLAEPRFLSAVKALTSESQLEDCVRALCRARVVVFDATEFEPAIMFLAGIRAAVRRGVTLLSVGGTYALGKQLNVPFNIADANIVAHSSEQKKAVALLAGRIRRGLEEMRSPYYFDLPVFDALRSLSAERRGIIPSEEGVLVLCPFDESYRSFWEQSLKEVLGEELEDLRSDRKVTGAPSFGVSRSFELNSPRLVTKAVFEAIRRFQSCVIDLSSWSPNVLFEFGVRLAASGERTACIIRDDWEQNTREDWKSQCQSFVSMFLPTEFTYRASMTYVGQRAYGNAYGRKSRPVADLLNGALHRLVERTLDIDGEPASRPAYLELVDRAALFSRDPGSGGRSKPVGLFPGNQELVRREETAEFERLLAAWFYIYHRYQLEKIKQDDKLRDTFLRNEELREASYSIAEALFQRHPTRLEQEIAGEIKESLNEVLDLVDGWRADNAGSET